MERKCFGELELTPCPFAERRKPARSLYEGQSERAEEEVGESGGESGAWEGNEPEQLR